jgi:hypothetical protein
MSEIRDLRRGTVGRTALLCGYDPESPAEKILIMSWSMCVTKQGLGKVVPAAGIVVGGALKLGHPRGHHGRR